MSMFSTAPGSIGAISSVSNSDGSLIVTPNTGIVIVSLNTGNGNIWTAAQAITGAVGTNFVPLTINQNDTGNNPAGIIINNSGTNNALRIVPTGNTGSSASTSGAFLLNNTGNTGIGMNINTNNATIGTAGLVFMKSSNASSTGPVLRLDQIGTGPALKINQTGNTGTTTGSSGGLMVVQNGTGFGIQFYSGAGAGNGALVHIEADNVLWNQPLLEISTAGTDGGAANVKLIGPVPQIEWVENDQTSPAGKFETGVNGNVFYIASRNNADSSFEASIDYNQLRLGGGINFHGTSSGATTIVPNAVAGSNILTLSTTAGTLMPVVGNGRVTGQIAAVASVLAYTIGAADSSFRISANVNVTAFAVGTFNVTCAYTDETNTSRTLTMTFSSITGTLGIAVAAAGAFEGVPLHIRCKAATTITFATTGTFTSLTYNAEASIVQIA